jgi:3-phenylpropionate/cinnamic acid dioxygenase small subunit
MLDAARGFAPGYAQCVDFLFHEAGLLDDGRLTDWLALLAPEIDYRIPTRITRERAAAASEFSDASFHMIEDLVSLRTRVARLETNYAYVDNPPTRTRRMISNVRLIDRDSQGALSVRSNFLVARITGDANPQLLCGERHDVLRFAGDELKLARRLILLDHNLLPLENLAFFL